MRPFDSDVTVQGNVITTSIQLYLLESLRPFAFTASDLERMIIELGFSESNSLSMRIADRLIQKYKKHGYVVYGSDRKWRVCSPSVEARSSMGYE